MIPRTEHGTYELLPCLHAYINHLRGKGMAGVDQADMFSVQRARLYRAKADIAEVERAQLAGDLVEVDDIEQAWIDMVTIVKTRLLTIPTKMAPRLALINSPTRIRELLDGDIHAALAELASIEVDATDSSSGTPNGRSTRSSN